MVSYAGIGEIALCDAGTLATTKLNALGLGIKDGAAKLTVSPFKEGRSNRNLFLPNKDLHKIEAATRQPTMLMLKQFIAWLNLGADIQLQTVKQGAGATSMDVLKYVGTYLLGIDFEYGITPDKWYLKLIADRAFEKALSETLIDSADTETAVDLSFTNPEDKDGDLYRAPYYLGIESPAASSILARADIKNRNFTIKVKGKRSDEDNTLWAYYLSFLLGFSTEKAAIADFMTLRGKALLPTFLIKESTDQANGYYDAFSFAAGTLTMKTELEAGDDDRMIKVTAEGDVPVNDVSFAFGDGNGGAVADTTGTTGGTMSIG